MALFRYLQRPGPGRLIAAGAALGLALCAKFSAILLVPIAVVLLVAGSWWPPASRPKWDRPRTGLCNPSSLMAWGVLGLFAVFVIQLLYFSERGPLLLPPRNAHGERRTTRPEPCITWEAS